MAQIKKIVKPGDLIRGAKVGVAGLDKDGNVVGFNAGPEASGKVLGFDENGDPVLVDPSSGQQYKFYETITGGGLLTGTVNVQEGE